MGYSPKVLRNMLAYVPRGKKYYVCGICGVNFNMAKMKDHLERDHNRKVEGAGYTFFAMLKFTPQIPQT